MDDLDLLVAKALDLAEGCGEAALDEAFVVFGAGDVDGDAAACG